MKKSLNGRNPGHSTLTTSLDGGELHPVTFQSSFPAAPAQPGHLRAAFPTGKDFRVPQGLMILLLSGSRLFTER